ncbi:MAG TPA: nucleotidyl transferase AbiEii/AbiGii toxin family protein [Bryobacteraceae bacterium]|nr:nucleotidyl transferase AbiEii/AbiGii toxin family protein [Bryobacteraceae bacterium]
MPAGEVYRRQAALLIRAIPLVATETCFALKGGTAINLFIRDMPRLSVDIDLTYLPIADRASSLKEIDGAMRRIANAIARGIRGTHVSPSKLQGENCITKVVVRADDVQIKIEVTPVVRGCVYNPSVRTVSPRVENQFGFAEIQVLSFPDLYAGKIVAALDRQHPRDLFDVQDLLAHEGIDQELRKAFIIYLLSHNRPMAEILAPARLDLSAEFARGFQGMTERPVSIEELLQAREDLVVGMVGRMPASHRLFLLSIKRGEPDWALLDLPGAAALPAVRWRLENLAKLARDKRSKLFARLNEALAIRD